MTEMRLLTKCAAYSSITRPRLALTIAHALRLLPFGKLQRTGGDSRVVYVICCLCYAARLLLLLLLLRVLYTNISLSIYL